MSSIFRIFIIVYFLSFRGVFPLNVDTVADNIVATKVLYCNSVSSTNEQTRKDEFYSHIAEQHLGLGVDSYARYSGNPPGGDMKLLQSEFVLASGQFDVERRIVRQGALCLWCREILEANIKPVYMDISSQITSIRRILDGVEKADTTKQAAIIDKVKAKIAPIGVTANKIDELGIAIASKLAIIEKLLATTDTFRNADASDTGVVMNSVSGNLQRMLANLAGYAQACRDIARANTAGKLDLVRLQQLRGIDLSYLDVVLQQLENHVLYVRSIFASTRVAAMGIARALFEDILNNGTLSSNGPHADPSINLFYQHNPANVIMKAELDASSPMSSWYNGRELVDNRFVVQRIKLGFQFDGANLFYGTMFPERP